MTVYQICYERPRPERTDDGLFEAIESLGPAHHALDSAWFVDVDGLTASDVRDELTRHIGPEDTLVITKLPRSESGRWAVSGETECGDWLREHL